MDAGSQYGGFAAQFVQIAAMIEASDDAIIGKTLDAHIVSWNRGAERLYGYTPDEAIGQSMDLIVPPELLGEPQRLVDRALRGERIQQVDTVRMTKAGRRVDVSLSISPVRNMDGEITGMITLARDVSEQVAARRSLEKMAERERNRAVVMETANRVALDILGSRTGVEALRHIAEAARKLANARYAALGVARPNGHGLQEFVTCGLDDEEEARIGPRPEGAGVLGLLLLRNDSLRIDVLGTHPDSIGFPPNHPPMDSFLGVPIRSGNSVMGSLYLTNKMGGGPFLDEDVTAVEALGAHAAVAIQNMHMLARQRSLVTGLIGAQEEERRAVAYDLHDGLTQYVMAAHAHLQAFRKASSAGRADKATRELDNGLQYLKEAVLESRRLVNGLRSLTLDELGLAGAIEQLITDEKNRAGWEDAEFVHNVAGARFHTALETTVFRVAQESVSNARKHAQTSRIRVLLLAQGDLSSNDLILEVRDWGSGFDTNRQQDGNHVGLQSMAERARLVNAHFELTSTVGEGTRVYGRFPVLDVAPRKGDQHV